MANGAIPVNDRSNVLVKGDRRRFANTAAEKGHNQNFASNVLHPRVMAGLRFDEKRLAIVSAKRNQVFQKWRGAERVWR
jgi:hypothetical protein